jgi:hypothetical protein
MYRVLLAVALTVALTACGSKGSTGAETFTLYRNSSLDNAVRVHWATLDASESDPSYNRNNCEMVARLLNANVDASSEAEGKERDPSVGFWCEPGDYSEKGSVPSSFLAAFPTDV